MTSDEGKARIESRFEIPLDINRLWYSGLFRAAPVG